MHDPADIQLRSEIGQHGFVEIFQAGHGIGTEPVPPVKLGMSFGPHLLPVLAQPVYRRIENHKVSARAQATPQFPQDALKTARSKLDSRNGRWSNSASSSGK